MKVFWGTLAAILVAAVIIGFVLLGFRECEKNQKMDADLRRTTLEIEQRQAFNEWYEQTRANPQFDPNDQKLMRRFAEIQDAIDNGKPIPPNPWTQKAVDVPAAAPTLMITLKDSVTVKSESGSLTIPSGTEVQYVSQVNDKVHVHYLNSDYFVPISATNLKEILRRSKE